MTTARPNPSHLSLTCRTVDVASFLEIGLLHLRSRGEVTDLLELPEGRARN